MPACVGACKKEGGNALHVGDLNNADSNVGQLVAKRAVKRLKEDLGTDPKVFYIGL